MMLKSKLGGEITEPPNCPNIASHIGLVDMFSRVLTPEKKEEVLLSFTGLSGTPRLIIAINNSFQYGYRLS